jgi:signal transduction histidine kinase
MSIVERMQRSCVRITRLVEDVLDFARGRLGGGIPLEAQEVSDLEQNLRHVVEELQGAYPDRTVHCAMDVDGSVVCDRNRVAQLFSNLLANALAHGASDQPVHVLASNNGGGFSLSVTNQGAPISPEARLRLFQPFWRPATESPQAGGLGLGLYIASQIARSHGGTLEVSSSAAEGTTFTFSLPAG